MSTSLLEAPPRTGASARRPEPLDWGPSPRPRLRPVRRPRLLSALDQAGVRAFVFLVAPAGYGKTTLLEQ